MSLLFKKIRWKNLLSTGNAWTELDLLNSKLTMIMGENGAGKSTLLDALSYVLYNKPYRRINKPQLVNSVNQKGMMVEIEFETGGKQYHIKRGIKPGIFEIYQNGFMLNQNAKAKDYQDVLERDILKMNHKSFIQIVILGSASFVPFMQLTAGQRREVIEDLLDLQIFSRMNNILKEKIQQNKTDIREIDYQIDLVNEKIGMQKKHMEEFARNNKAMIARKKERISESKVEIEKFNKKLADITKKIEEVTLKLEERDKIESKSRKIDDMISRLATTRKKVDKKASFFEDNDNCPTCKQSIDESFKTEQLQEIENKRTEIQNAIQELNERYTAVNEKMAEFEYHSGELSAFLVKQTKINQEIYSLNTTIGNLQSEIEEVSNIEPEDNIAEFKAEIEVYNRRKTELNQLTMMYRVGNEMLKDSGIKSRIIKQYIPVMNKLINHYLGQLGFFVQFELDENFNETIKSRYLDVFSYDSFSEGEKLRIDLSLLFTWRQIAKLRNSVSTNLLIMDEVFDSSLDVNGTDEFIKILEGLANDTNTYIISHKAEQLMDKFPSIIRFMKRGNFSIKEET